MLNHVNLLILPNLCQSNAIKRHIQIHKRNATVALSLSLLLSSSLTLFIYFGVWVSERVKQRNAHWEDEAQRLIWIVLQYARARRFHTQIFDVWYEYACAHVLARSFFSPIALFQWTFLIVFYCWLANLHFHFTSPYSSFFSISRSLSLYFFSVFMCMCHTLSLSSLWQRTQLILPIGIIVVRMCEWISRYMCSVYLHWKSPLLSPTSMFHTALHFDRQDLWLIWSAWPYVQRLRMPPNWRCRMIWGLA